MMEFAQSKRIVVKVGTSTLTYHSGNINLRRLELLVKVLSDLKNSGIEIILVTSGAIGVGIGKIGLLERPKDTPTKQACAAVGQCELMYLYDKYFSEYNHIVSQVLLTKGDLLDEDRQINAKNTFNCLLEMGTVPVVNENDTVAVEEIVFGDNDTLGAVVSVLTKADWYVILSDIDGLYSSDPKENPNAKIIHEVCEVTQKLYEIAGGAGSNRGTGGMQTKINAAEIALKFGVNMTIINGENPTNLYDLYDGKQIGTNFIAKNK